MEVAKDSSAFSNPFSIPMTVATSALIDIDDALSTRFTSLEELFRTIKTVKGNFLVVHDISLEDVNLLERNRSRSYLRFRLRRYYAATRTLLVVIPTGPHEGLHIVLYEQIRDRMVIMGKSESWSTMGAPTMYSLQPGVGSGGVKDRGEGDSSGGPFPQRGAGGWPTLVIEAGYSQSLASLRAAGLWWFSASRHQVKIVLLCKMNRDLREIRIERWQETPPPERTGATMTRRATQLTPACYQVITLTLQQGRDHADPRSYEVIRDPLVLEYGLLFLEPPGPGGGDIVLDASKLRYYASRVWDRFTAENLREILGL